ncbi:MAG: DNA-3-methyladenine glycosylase 2 family protein [Pseudomonadota bacterium]
MTAVRIDASPPSVIETDAHVAEGARWLAAAEPRFAHALAVVDGVPLRRRPGGFATLLRAICGQQLSVASAQAVWTKLEAADACNAPGILALDDDGLRACGLSRQKMAYARALAEADLDFEALARVPEEEAIATLTAIKGIGVWTAEVYLMFAVGRPDVFAPGDLALQEGARMLFDLPERPREKALRQMAGAWSPWRAVAARLLWAYYAQAKSREGVDP